MKKIQSKKVSHAKLRGRSPLALIQRRSEREAAEVQNNVLELVSHSAISRTMFDALMSIEQARKPTGFCFDERKARLLKRTETLHNLTQLALNLSLKDTTPIATWRPNAETFNSGRPEKVLTSPTSLSFQFGLRPIHQVEVSYANFAAAAADSISKWLYSLVLHSSGTSAVFPAAEAQASVPREIEELLRIREANAKAEQSPSWEGDSLTTESFNYEKTVHDFLEYSAQKLPADKRKNAAPDTKYMRWEWAHGRDNEQIKTAHSLAQLLSWEGSQEIIYENKLNYEVEDLFKRYRLRSLTETEKCQILASARENDLKRADQKIQSEQNTLVSRGWSKDLNSYVAAIRNTIHIVEEEIKALEVDQSAFYGYVAGEIDPIMAAKRLRSALQRQQEKKKRCWLVGIKAEGQKFIQHHWALASNPFDLPSIESFLWEVVEHFTPESEFPKLGISPAISEHVLMTLYADWMLSRRMMDEPERLSWQKTLSRQFFLDLLPSIGTPLVREHVQVVGGMLSDELNKQRQLTYAAMRLNAHEHLSPIFVDEYLADLKEFANMNKNQNISEAAKHKILNALAGRKTSSAEERMLLDKINKNIHSTEGFSESNLVVLPRSPVAQAAAQFDIYHGHHDYFQAWLAAAANNFNVSGVTLNTIISVKYSTPHHKPQIVGTRGAGVTYAVVQEKWPLLSVMSRRYMAARLKKKYINIRFNFPNEFPVEFASLLTDGAVINDFDILMDVVKKRDNHHATIIQAYAAIKANTNVTGSNDSFLMQLNRAQTVKYRRGPETADIDHLFRVDGHIYSLLDRDFTFAASGRSLMLERSTTLADHVLAGMSFDAKNKIHSPFDVKKGQEPNEDGSDSRFLHYKDISRNEILFFPQLEFRSLMSGGFASEMMSIHLARVQKDIDIATISPTEQTFNTIAERVADVVTILMPISVLMPPAAGLLHMLLSTIPDAIRAGNADTHDEKNAMLTSLVVGLAFDGLGQVAGPVLSSGVLSKAISKAWFGAKALSRIPLVSNTALLDWVGDIRRKIRYRPLHSTLSVENIGEILASTSLWESALRGNLIRKARLLGASKSSWSYIENTHHVYEQIREMAPRCEVVLLSRWDFPSDLAPISHYGVRLSVDGESYIVDVGKQAGRFSSRYEAGDIYIGHEAEWLERITSTNPKATYKLRVEEPGELLHPQKSPTSSLTDGLLIQAGPWYGSDAGFPQRYLQVLEYLRSRSWTENAALLDELISKKAFRSMVAERVSTGQLGASVNFVNADLRDIRKTGASSVLNALVNDFLRESATPEMIMTKLDLLQRISQEAEWELISVARKYLTASERSKNSEMLSQLLITKVDLDVLLDNIWSHQVFLQALASNAKIYNQYDTLIKFLSSAPPGVVRDKFNFGKSNFDKIVIPGLPKDGPSLSSSEMRRRFVEHNEILSLQEKGAFSVLIEEMAKKEDLSNILKNTKMVLGDWAKVATERIPAPQGFVLSLMGAGRDGRCLPLSRAMSVALSVNSEQKLIDNLFEVAATAKSQTTKEFIDALKNFHSSTLLSGSFLIVDGALNTHRIVETVASRARDIAFHEVYLQIDTVFHAMLVGARRHSRGGRQYFFYEPNFGIAFFSSEDRLKQALDTHFIQRKFGEYYTDFGTANEPMFHVTELFPKKFESLVVGRGLTVRGLSSDLTTFENLNS